MNLTFLKVDYSSLKFWSTSIVDVLVQILGLFFLQESKISLSIVINHSADTPSKAFAPVLLERKANQLKRQQDPENASNAIIRTVYDKDRKSEIFFSCTPTLN